MPGLVPASSAATFGAVAGMKRAFEAETVPAYGDAHPKKRRVVRSLHHRQPVDHVVEPIAAEFDATGVSKEFFDHQVRRSIALQCKVAGFDGARPEAMEQFVGLLDSYMTNITSLVRQSMTSARRTQPVAHDWIYALNSTGLTGSSLLESHLDTSELPPSLLQPAFAPAEPPEAPPPDIEGLLGPELSGKAEKQSRKHIPAHFPPFPSKHTWRSTPVYTERENDPRKIREKATEEGILAEQSLRKLMAARKAGIQKDRAGKRKKSKRIRESDKLWKEAMENVLEEEAEEEDKARQAAVDDDGFNKGPSMLLQLNPRTERKVDLEKSVYVNYDQKFWRKSARGV
ncbi:transcription factor TFIID complex subunit 8 C-term-domain-containing protein [Massariosphaeria phaeospora]|uniref:Transcription initiation factor TFIID subunit 8 n=1 Tax=Massariosphaeria phaeospora TaxID=100035 RepID=A0A7C8IBW0_9PLEO|nr:transcription factor TFIID complex subunit 8 C-term-domain-containing protein [Massariosphaeria phaeospora]